MKALRALGLYALLTVLLTYPLALRMRVMDAGDSAFFAWIMAWEIHALATDPLQLPHANMYHPLRYTLGMDEPVLGTTLLVLPFAPFTPDAVLLYNLARLMTFALSALTAYLLARSLGCGEGAALFGGAAFAFSPIRTDQIAHLSTLGTQWLPLVLLFLHRLARHGLLRDALLAALFFVLAALACGYHAVIAVAVLPAPVLVLFWGRWRRLPAAALAALLAVLGLVPLYLLHRAALSPFRYVRGHAETVLYSAALESFLSASTWNRLYGDLTAPFRTTSANLFPGLLLPALVLLGLLARRGTGWRPSRDALALALMGLGGALVALGPEVRFMGRTLCAGPFALAREAVPFFQNIRVTSRAGIFLALALAMLAAKALAAWRGAGPALAVAAGGVAMAESLIAPIPMPAWSQVVDSSQPPPPVYAWLAGQAGSPALVELPMQGIEGIFARPVYHESIYLVRSTHHWKRLANGFAGLEPAAYLELREKARRFPAPDCLALFRQRGLRYVVLHQDGYGPNKRARLERELPALRSELVEVARFGGDIVFELVPRPERPSP